MAAIGLSPGIIKSMTRGAPERSGSSGPDLDTGMSLLDKLNLLRLVAEVSPPDLDLMLDEIRKSKGEAAPTVYGRLRDLVQPSLIEP